MILNYDTIINRITVETSFTKQEIENKISQKLKDFQDLISKEGAAHMVANELNIKLFDSSPKELKITNLSHGLNSINILARIIAINDIKTYKKDNREGRIASFFIGDETGTTRLVIWDENLINESTKFKEGDIIKILNAYSKENNGYKELHLGNKAQIQLNPPNETVGEIKINATSKRKDIADLKENEFAEVLGYIVQAFEPKFYNACPVCNKKLLPQDDKFTCIEHNLVDPKKVLIFNAFVDDGSSNIRVVFFRDVAEKLIGKEPSTFEDIKKNILGKQFLIKGKVNKNEMFYRIELMANSVEDPQPEKIIEELELKN